MPIKVNNPGEGIKNADQLSMKWDIKADRGTFTSITSYDALDEILTGDAFDFRPRPQSFNEVVLGPFVIAPIAWFLPPNQVRALSTDWNQSQYLNVRTTSQEFRYASDTSGKLSWLGGVYLLQTNRYISTGNMIDTGDGVNRVYKTPRTTTGFPADFSIPNPQWTYLADGQDNFAWAAFGSVSYNFTDQWDATFSARYDEDTREQTTLTPPGFIPAALAGDLVTGQKRKETWDAMQPKVTVRWRPTDKVTLYGDVSRGFRSGGFNQSGVALAGVAGVKDTFDEQIADTIEVGIKTQLNNNRISLNAAVFDTDLSGAYYFIFLVASSTQNLGSIDKSHYKGVELEFNALLTDNWNVNLAYATTDSTIKADAEVPNIVGKKVPLVPEYTVNVGTTWTKPLNRKSGTSLVIRGDYRRVGKTVVGPGRRHGHAAAMGRDPARYVQRARRACRPSGQGLGIGVLGQERPGREVQRRVLVPVRVEGGSPSDGASRTRRTSEFGGVAGEVRGAVVRRRGQREAIRRLDMTILLQVDEQRNGPLGSTILRSRHVLRQSVAVTSKRPLRPRRAWAGSADSRDFAGAPMNPERLRADSARRRPPCENRAMQPTPDEVRAALDRVLASGFVRGDEPPQPFSALRRRADRSRARRRGSRST